MNEDDVEDAIAQLEAALVMSPREGKLLSKWDQVRAECRDDPVKRQQVIDALVADGCERQDAEDWVDNKEM